MKEDKFWRYALYTSFAAHIIFLPVVSMLFDKVTAPFHESSTVFYEVSMAESAGEEESAAPEQEEAAPPEEVAPPEPQEAVAVPEVPQDMKPEPRPEPPKREEPKPQQKRTSQPSSNTPSSNASDQERLAAARAQAEADAARRAAEQERRTTVVNPPYPLSDPKPANPTPGQAGVVYVEARIYENGQVANVSVSGDANEAQQNAVAVYIPTVPFAPGTNVFGDPLPSIVRFSVRFQ